jgi:dipeptidyl aminopeptidase/acylaminoacyl peptidase
MQSLFRDEAGPPRAKRICFILAAILVLSSASCSKPSPHYSAPQTRIEPFTFPIASADEQFQIDGFFAKTDDAGKQPALLILEGAGGDARQCINRSASLVAIGIRVACISIPGYGKSSGPSRFVGPPAIEAARRALDLVSKRPDVDPTRLAVWGQSEGAVAAGLLMDADPRPRAVILQSGAYDLLRLWPEASLGTKLSILRQVWPSKRALKERSVVENLPRKIDCSVLILHGQRDHKMPVSQAEQLAQALSERGARVETYYFPDGTHNLGMAVYAPLRSFLRDNLIQTESAAS